MAETTENIRNRRRLVSKNLNITPLITLDTLSTLPLNQAADLYANLKADSVSLVNKNEMLKLAANKKVFPFETYSKLGFHLEKDSQNTPCALLATYNLPDGSKVIRVTDITGNAHTINNTKLGNKAGDKVGFDYSPVPYNKLKSNLVEGDFPIMINRGNNRYKHVGVFNAIDNNGTILILDGVLRGDKNIILNRPLNNKGLQKYYNEDDYWGIARYIGTSKLRKKWKEEYKKQREKQEEERKKQETNIDHPYKLTVNVTNTPAFEKPIDFFKIYKNEEEFNTIIDNKKNNEEQNKSESKNDKLGKNVTFGSPNIIPSSYIFDNDELNLFKKYYNKDKSNETVKTEEPIIINDSIIPSEIIYNELIENASDIIPKQQVDTISKTIEQPVVEVKTDSTNTQVVQPIEEVSTEMNIINNMRKWFNNKKRYY